MTTQVKNEKRVWWRFESQVLTNNRLIAALSWCDCLIVRFEMLQTCSDTAPPHLMSKRCLRLFNRLTRSSEKACWHLKGALFNFCVVSVAGGWFMLTASTCKLSVSSISSLCYWSGERHWDVALENDHASPSQRNPAVWNSLNKLSTCKWRHRVPLIQASAGKQSAKTTWNVQQLLACNHVSYHWTASIQGDKG